jgi:gamma-glutamylcyclotransferase (GGCT)/AIG2-like uncharacterized protein YtfP
MKTKGSDSGARHSSPVTYYRLFVYGTLMEDDVVAELTGQCFRKEAAVLAGYRRVVPDGGFPFIVPETDGVVEGFLLHDVDEEAMCALDRYEDEGRLYRRTAVVVSSGGRQQSCMTYVGIAAALTRSEPAG